MSTSIPPPVKKDSGNTKYIVLGLLFIVGGSFAAYMAVKPSGQPTQNPPRVVPPLDSGVAQQSLTPNVAANIDLTEEPDVPTPVEDATAPRVRYVVRYVDQCPGTIDAARVDAILGASQSGFRECYNRELRTNASLRGGASVRFVINPNGSVGDIQTGGIVRSGQFKACFETVLRRLRFPAPRGGCAVKETRFNFST